MTTTVQEFSPVLTSPAMSAHNLRQMIRAYALVLECLDLLGRGRLDDQSDLITMRYLVKVYNSLSSVGDIPHRVMYMAQLLGELRTLRRWIYMHLQTEVKTPIPGSATVPAWLANAPTEPKLPLIQPRWGLPDRMNGSNGRKEQRS